MAISYGVDLEIFVVLHVFLVPIISSHDKLWGLPRRVFTLFEIHCSPCFITEKYSSSYDVMPLTRRGVSVLTHLGDTHLRKLAPLAAMALGGTR